MQHLLWSKVCRCNASLFKRCQQFQSEDGVAVAGLAHQKHSVLARAQVMGRSPITISRELRCRPQSALSASTWAQQRCLQGHPLDKRHRDGILFGLMRNFLCERWWPEQIALTLARFFARGHGHRVSYETIHNCTYAQPVSKLKRVLVATRATCPQQARTSQQRAGLQRRDLRHGEQPPAPA